MSRREEILEKVRAVPSIPASASEALHLINDPDFEMEKLIRLIELDHVATANILRLANSAFFSHGAAVDSIRAAVVRLGAQRVSQLMMVSSVGPVACRPLRGYEMAPGEMWRHSVAAAVCTELIAKAQGLRAPQHTFTAGLLHGVGKVVLDVFVAADAEPIKGLAFTEHIPFDAAERQILGIDHAEVGAVLLESWRIPGHLVDCVRWHLRPDKASDSDMALDLVHMANHVAIQAGVGVGVDADAYSASPLAMKRLKLDADGLSAVAEELTLQLGSIQELLDMSAAA